MKFDAQRAYQHIAQLAIPRAVGSEGEAKARAYIVEQLSAIGLRVEEESFHFTQFPAEVLPRLIFVASTIAVLIACWVSPNHPLLAGLLCDGVLVGVLALTRWQRSLEWLYNIGRKHTSKNIIATRNAVDDANFRARLCCTLRFQIATVPNRDKGGVLRHRLYIAVRIGSVGNGANCSASRIARGVDLDYRGRRMLLPYTTTV